MTEPLAIAIVSDIHHAGPAAKGSVPHIDTIPPVGRLARKLRVEYPGAIYHVMNRGDRREAIFLDDQDRERFIATLAEAGQKTGWQAPRCA